MSQSEMSRKILVNLLVHIVQAREEAQRVEARARRFLKTNKTLKAHFDAFMESGGGTIEELDHWLVTSPRPRPCLAQKKHMRLVVANDKVRPG